MKKYGAIIITLIAVIIIVLVPLPADDLFIRFSLREGNPEGYRLYYTTPESPYFNDEQCVGSVYYEKDRLITFRLDGSLEGRIENIRFDLPPEEGSAAFDGVVMNSGGLVVKRLSAPRVFDGTDLIYTNSVTVQTVDQKETAYVFTGADDPYVMFGPELISAANAAFSHKFITKAVASLLLALGAFFYSRDLFGNKD